MDVTKTITVNADPDHVWNILGPNYVDSGKWASNVYVATATTGASKAARAPVSGRLCQTSLGAFTESIETYDPEARSLSYSAQGDSMPGFVKGLTGSWSITPKGKGCEVQMNLRAHIAFPLNYLMGPMMKLQFNKALRETLEEFKHYCQTGVPHPRKIKVDGTKKATDARQAIA